MQHSLSTSSPEILFKIIIVRSLGLCLLHGLLTIHFLVVPPFAVFVFLLLLCQSLLFLLLYTLNKLSSFTDGYLVQQRRLFLSLVLFVPGSLLGSQVGERF